MHSLPGYGALITWLIMHWSRDWSCTDHIIDPALITWLIMHWSRDGSCTDHVAIMHWSLGWLYTDHVPCHAQMTWLITWLIMHWSSGYHALITWLTCTDLVVDIRLFTCLIMHRSRGWSYTADVAVHALITCLSCSAHLADPPMIT